VYRIQGLVSRIQGSRFGAQDPECRESGYGLRCWVQGIRVFEYKV
jgi:hypothetical protein